MRVTISCFVSAVVLLFAASGMAQSGNASRGERLFNQQCKACHTLDQGGASPVGPNLHGLIGSKAGSAPGFNHSEAMKKSGIVWDDKTLAEYLKDPKGRVPGTKMTYAGLKRQEQLDDMIAYLEKATK
jgi:cytochrome c